MERADVLPDTPRAGRGRPWLTLTATVLGGAMVGLDGTATTIAAPYISASVGASLGQLELIANAYLVALAVGLLPAGRLADRIGRRRTFVFGVLAFGAASLGIALSGSVWALVLFRVLQGFAGALLQPAALALVRNAFPAEKLGLPLGIWGGVNALAIGLGPVIAGVIVQGFGWPAVFAVNAPIAVVTVALAYFAITESKGSRDAAAGALRRLLANRAVSLGSVLVAISFFGVFGLLFLLTLYLQNVQGMAPIMAGAWMLPPTCVVVLSAPIGGLLAQRFGPKWPVSAGLVLVTAGLTGLTLLRADSGFSELLYPGVLVGFGTGLCVIAATEAIMGATPDDSTGVASALQQVACQVGGVLGIVSAGAVLSWQVGVALPERAQQAGLPQPIGDALLGEADAIAQGTAAPGFDPPTVGDSLAGAARIIGQFSFLDAMAVALLIAAAVSLVGAVIALWLPRAATPAVEPSEPGNPLPVA
ncbi:MFS transporter [Amycolatopsis nigrescens]|uniref:MFS transporter n=1 Tax=Amycolatopsis nigrescens TaxID=381445 RepID=UPI0006886D1D|nr:MFS transporter [Amycolatopsis nigrescens]